jgi:hypothetical protein
LDDGTIQRHLAGREQTLYLAEKYGSVIGASVIYGGPGIPAQKESIVAEHAFKFGARVTRITEREHVNEFDVVEDRRSA